MKHQTQIDLLQQTLDVLLAQEIVRHEKNVTVALQEAPTDGVKAAILMMLAEMK